jgi:4-amino-4-deoxy-L-arabinose transferase-like glycosyltransferase
MSADLPTALLLRRSSAFALMSVAAVLTHCTIVLLWQAVTSGVNRDEHYFMASAFMAAHEGLHPYRDFAHFHMPNLVYVYASFFLYTPHAFLAARLFVFVCAMGICLAVLLDTRSRFARHGTTASWILAATAALMLVESRLLQLATSHVWNHNPATLCAVGAFLMHSRAMHSRNPLPWYLGSGAALGMAIGIRLSFAPMAIPFLFAILFLDGRLAVERGRNLLAFAIGGLVTNAPGLYFLITTTEDLLFGALGYAALNTAYRGESGHTHAMSLAMKLADWLQVIRSQTGDTLIVSSCVTGIALLGLDRFRRPAPLSSETILLTLTIPFVVLGALAPTPTWPQYYFAPAAFLVLLAMHTLADIKSPWLATAGCTFVAVAVAASTLSGAPRLYRHMLPALFAPTSWIPLQIDEQAAEIRRRIAPAQSEDAALTLTPLYAIASGLSIYPEHVMSPFGWRVSHLLSTEQAARHRIPSPAQTEVFLRDRRPRVILTGKEAPPLEAPLITTARQLGYQPTTMSSGIVVWLRPH